MGAFEDNIRSKFNSAEVPLESGSWDAFEHKLDGAQMSDLLFTQKVVNALEFSLVPYSPEHWKVMHQKLDLDVDGNFESDVRSKFSEANFSGPVVGWEDMLSKLDATDMGELENAVKDKINKGEAEYNKEHWKAMKKVLDNDKKPVLWVYLLVGVFVLGVATIWGLSESETNMVAENSSDSKQETLSTEEQLILGTNSKEGFTERNINTELVFENDVVGNDKEAIKSGSLLNKSVGRNKFKRESEKEFRNKHHGLVVNNKSNKKRVKSNKKNSQIGGGSKRNATGSVSSTVERSTEVNAETNESAEDELFVMAEMSEVKVALSQPYLDYQFTDVQYEKIKIRKSVLHLGLLPLLNFWDNAASTGLSGKDQISLFSSQNWKVYRRYGKQVDFEFNLPFQILGGYEHRFQNSGFSVGTYVSNKWQDNWVCSTVNASSSYEKELSNSLLRFGAGLSYKRNQLQTAGLTLRDQVSSTTALKETALDELKVPAETYLMTNVGVMLANEHFMFAYNVNNPVLIRINYENERQVNHTGLVSGTVSLSNSVKLSGVLKVSRADNTDFTPTISLSKDNDWFFMASFEELNRYVYSLGYQFSKFRVYTSYGHVTRKEVESGITDLYSQSGHVAVGLVYTRQ